MNKVQQIIDCLMNASIEISKMLRITNPIYYAKYVAINESGDKMKMGDKVSDELITNTLVDCKYIKAYGSEEMADIVETHSTYGEYLVVWDPLDGSGNIGVGLSVGTIFCIFKYNEDCINSGRDIVAAGYFLYSSSTQMVVATDKVRSYILNDKYELMNDNLRIPNEGKIYSINEGNKKYWNDQQVIKYIQSCGGKSLRWNGCMVSDCHRVLHEGGSFMYPSDTKRKNGKLRLVYEAYPFAYIFFRAGGYSVMQDTCQSILDLAFPKNLHQKVPVMLFGPREIRQYQSKL